MKHARPDYDRFQDPLGLIPEDEPVFLLRGQDFFAHRAVSSYSLECAINGMLEIASLSAKQAARMKAWSEKHGKRPDVPSTPITQIVRDALLACEAAGNLIPMREALADIERKENG